MDTEEQIRRLQASARTLGKAVGPAKAALQGCSKEQPLEQAILHVALARAAVALAEMQLCAVGASNSAASCQPEKDRLKLYDEKVQKAATAVWLAKHKPSTQINVGAANRFISHALPELTPAQKAALKQATKAAKDSNDPSSTPRSSRRPPLAPQSSGKVKKKGGNKPTASAAVRLAADALLSSLPTFQ